MNSEQLMNAFSCLDDELIERSEVEKPRIAWHKWAGMAACVAILTVAILATRGMWQKPGAQQAATQFAPGYTPAAGETDVVTEHAEHEWEAGYTPKPGERDDGDTERAANGAAAMLPDSVGIETVNITPMIESYKMDADACYAAPMNGTVNFSMPLRAAMAEYGDSARYRVVVDLFRDERQLAADSAEAAAERERLSALGYTVAYETVYNHEKPVSAYFTLHATRDELNALSAGEYGYMLFLYDERVQGAEQIMPETVFNGASVPVDSTEVMVCPRDTSEVLTAAEARADAAFGAYLCNAPAGFDEQEFRRTAEQLRASFRRGYDYVEWSVRAFQEEDRERLITVVAETEQYDVSLYSIPYADSVPAKLHTIFYHPIFRIEDLTLDIVKARAYRVNEVGDSDGWRCSFSVLYGDVLVQVNTKGIDPEWLYRELVALR